MNVLYCLRCEGDRYYVGQTPMGRFETRLDEHINWHGAKWTTLHKPLEVLWKRHVSDTEVAREEDRACCEIMRQFGINSCRGGLFNIGRDVRGLPWWAKPVYKQYEQEILAASS